MKKNLINAVIFVPLVLIFFFVYKFGITIPFWDQWELVPLLEKMHNHTLALADIWALHNEHRIIFPQTIMLLLASLSNWNIFLELCTNLILAVFILLFLLSIIRRTIRTNPLLLQIFTSLMVFSMVQYENWGWGWQIQIFLSVLGFIIAVWSLNKWQGKMRGLIIAISAAVLSSYSFNTGLLTWPVIFFILLIQKEWKLKHIIILIITCIGTVLLYYHNYTKPSYHPSVLYFLKHPVIYVRYVLTYLGTSLSSFSPASFITALIILALISSAIFNIWRFDKQKLREFAPLLALALYACLAACATGIGRAGFGWQQAAESRYTTISALLPISTGVLFFYSIKFNPRLKNNATLKNLFLTIIVFVFTLSYVSSYYSGIQSMKSISKKVYSSAFCLNNPQNADDYSLRKLYPKPEIVRSRIIILSELGIKFKAAQKRPN